MVTYHELWCQWMMLMSTESEHWALADGSLSAEGVISSRDHEWQIFHEPSLTSINFFLNSNSFDSLLCWAALSNYFRYYLLKSSLDLFLFLFPHKFNSACLLFIRQHSVSLLSINCLPIFPFLFLFSSSPSAICDYIHTYILCIFIFIQMTNFHDQLWYIPYSNFIERYLSFRLVTSPYMREVETLDIRTGKPGLSGLCQEWSMNGSKCSLFRKGP